MLKVFEVALARPDAVAESRYPVPALSMLRLLNDARPLEAASVVVPDSVPLLGLVPIAMVMLLLAVVTRLPPASRTSTCTAGVMVAPPAVFAGCTRKPSLVAGPIVMLNVFEVAPVRTPEVALRVYPVPALSMLRLLNVATPLTAARVTVPDR